MLTIVATLGDVKASILVRNRGYTRAQWHAEITAAFEPLVLAAGLAVGFWLWMAWANGRGYRWPRVLFALFFCVNTYSLLHGLAGGPARYAGPDLAAGTVLWLVEFAAVALVFGNELRRIATSPSGTTQGKQRKTP